MNATVNLDTYEVGYDIPASIGMDEADIQTPCLVVDLDAFEHNIEVMRAYCEKMGIRHRLHGKMHKSVDVANYQIEKGNSCGVCCQKVSEAEVFARAGIKDVLVSNQVRDPAKIDRLANLPTFGARTICCVDDIDNVAELSEAAVRHGTEIEVLVEIDCGAGRCGVSAGQPVVDIAKAVEAAEGLKFSGIQAYQGAMQHMKSYEDRKEKIDIAVDMVKQSMEMLKAEGLECDIVGGGGTGSYYFEGASGVYNELQCGSYAFMDADYQTIHDEKDQPISEFKNSLFILTSVMSHAKSDKAICDAGLKAQSIDSGLPYIFGRDDVEYIKCSDEHGVIEDSGNALKVNDKLKLVPGHCDPTCNVHDWYVGVRNGKVESLWPVSARGKAY
ncbi:3-hydroxy-D-aspartate aldolase BhcC [Solemya velum gill symbiont]|uniref:3-hydroxy-D-aspartate aldolase n=1 Tax=Solemya velum gill symbiont TaxID=2340 RepID=A0A0B0H988_SOVGS|nr:3-hydroxy-D-aspartate aldolase BhcC [Solemya velum gill symbiont]KHF24399.1 D-3-hydroxyaspartate aldolase [Solemya velum gill symbiont]OOY33844.1 alanine racemase [Solemya velum gill symbiont]OOY37022.1 alanine racemase [Solemya velum gill symbiont]OOY39176.1 alanine racemase [Solemya velum gill symbiont]OOY44490.1 alanine racemase [Solemya velum gill symbiont]